MGTKEVGVDLDGTVEWHFPGVSGADSATLCGLDGNDPSIGRTGIVDAPRSTKINCQGTILQWLRELQLREADFTDV